MSSTDPVRVLVIGDPYMPSSAYAEPLAGLGDMVEVTSMQIEGVGFAPPRTDRMSFFAVPIEAHDVPAMVQHEGAERRLFTAEGLAVEARVAPWDLAVVLMHARRRVLFGGLASALTFG